jgi:hypothetical protein
MESEGHKQALNKEAMKQLRQARKQVIVAVSARVKEQKEAIAAIKAELQQGDRTVPEIAAATSLPPDAVLWYLATLKKYGEVAEGQKDGSYFRYRLAASGRE